MGQTFICKVRRFMLWTVAAVMLATCTGVGAKSGYQYQPPVDLGDGWQTAAPQDYGMDVHLLTDMVRDIEDGGYESLHSVLIVKDGQLVFEAYFQGYQQNWAQEVASVTKSVTSILIGIAIDQGLIKGADQSLSELLPAYRELLNADTRKQKLQLWHILTMTSRLEWDEETYPYGDLRNDATRLERSPDAV
jgi:CubicO group peptidase (beta-lactamase class C family)